MRHKTIKSPKLSLYLSDWIGGRGPRNWVCDRELRCLFDIRTANKIVLVLSTRWSEDSYRVYLDTVYFKGIMISGDGWSKRFDVYSSLYNFVLYSRLCDGKEAYASIEVLA